MLSNAMNYLIVRNNDIHHINTRQNYFLCGSRPTCKPIVNTFSNRSAQIWNAISSKLNIYVSLYKFKFYVKLLSLYNKLIIIFLLKQNNTDMQYKFKKKHSTTLCIVF